MYEVYDAHKVAGMGKDMGYMGSFQTIEAAKQYIEEFKHLFEGDAVIHYPEVLSSPSKT